MLICTEFSLPLPRRWFDWAHHTEFVEVERNEVRVSEN